MNLSAKHHCSFPELYVHNEHRDGMHSLLAIKCRNCNNSFQVDNDIGERSLDCNSAAIWAGNASGIGFSALEHSLATLEVPFMSFNTNSKYENTFHNN